MHHVEGLMELILSHKIPESERVHVLQTMHELGKLNNLQLRIQNLQTTLHLNMDFSTSISG